MATGFGRYNENISTESESIKAWSLDRMPPCSLPPMEEFTPVEHYVTVAITTRSESSRDTTSDKKHSEQKSEDSSLSYLSGYRAILDCIRKRNDPPMLWKILLALRGRSLSLIASCPSQHAHLLHVIMKCNVFHPPKSLLQNNLVSTDPSKAVLNDISNEEAIAYFTGFTIADAYLHLLVGLVSANSIFLIPCLESIWKNLVNDPTTSNLKTSRLHSALATTLRLVPKANTELFPVLSRNIPFRRAKIIQQEWYAKQCLAILTYQPEFQEEILNLLIEKCLEIDVEIKVDKGGNVSLDEKEEDEDMFDLDVDEDERKKKKEEEKKMLAEKIEVDEMAERLDVLLTILMKHIQEYSSTSTHAMARIVGILFRVFNSVILTTHRSKYVQFLIMYICGLEDHQARSMQSPSSLASSPDIDSRIYRQFATQLINNLLAPGFTPVERQSSVCYLASFIARSSFISSCTVCESIAALLRWAEAYIDTYYDVSMDKNNMHIGSNASGGKGVGYSDQQLWKRKVQTHAVFYNVCQAAFYIMCFRGKEAVEYYEKAAASSQNYDDETYVDLISVDIGAARWERLCRHEHLQPLRYCLESVRREFLFITRVFHLLPKPLIETLEEEDEKMANAIADRQARLQNSSARKKKIRRSISTPATKEKHRLRNAELKRKGEKIGGGVGGLGKGSNPLDSFFPFDPCLLRLSHGFIESFYIDWDGGVEIENELEHSQGEFSDDDDDDDDDSSMSCESSSSSSSSDGEEEMDDVLDPEPMNLTSIGERMAAEMQNVKRIRAQSIGSGSW